MMKDYTKEFRSKSLLNTLDLIITLALSLCIYTVSVQVATQSHEIEHLRDLIETLHPELENER